MIKAPEGAFFMPCARQTINNDIQPFSFANLKLF
jgi:hypothetical protein